MASLFSSLPFGKAKADKAPNQRGGRLGNVDYLLIAGGICTILGTVWLGWRYDKFEGIFNLWQEPEYEVDTSSTKFHDFHEPVVNITILTSAVESGAVCLDGSPPAYFLARGSGTGVNNWVVFHEGGGWCASDEACLERSFTMLGSSKHMPRNVHLGGVLSGSPIANPDFYNWNRVMLKYCDGGSFNGDVSDPKQVEIQPDTHPFKMGKAPNIFYRGQRIWKAVMEDLLENGMKNAHKAFLTGCSAGGLASILHCDQYRDLLPKKSTVKCSSDAGFFIDIPDISGRRTIEALYLKVVSLQNMVGNLPKSCTSQRAAAQCIFPEYVIPDISTPFFMLNSAYDTWQFENVLVPRAADPEGSWDNCKNVLASCSDSQLKVAQGFRENLLKRLEPLLADEKHGVFINSCFVHCQSQDSTWSGPKGPKVNDKSIAQVIGDWYFERHSSKVIDCPFPCNPTCGRH